MKLNDNLTDFFKVDSGVKQGCKLSPTLFAIYINDLVNDINSLSAGVTMDEKVISSLLYADDIALIAPDEISLQKMLDAVGEWCKRWRLIVNKEKTKILHFRTSTKHRSNFNFKCGTVELDFSTNYRYLGLWLNESMDFKYTVNELCKSASRAFGALYSKFISASGMSYDVYTRLYESLVEPVMFYGAGIWGLSEQKCVNYIQNKACRYFLGCYKNTSNIATRGDMGWMSPITKQHLECYRFLFRLETKDENSIIYQVFK